MNDQHWTPGSNAPIFICTAGEWSIESLDDGVCENAEQWLPETKALMVALEHRYYGCHDADACPVRDDGSETNMFKYLSSRQAIEDIATFVKAMNVKYGLTAENKWVTWGGSYAGMISGWSRLKHPELIHAAMASSAPVRAQLDYPEYYGHTTFAYSVSDNMVGGSVECEQAIVNGHRQLEVMLKTPDGTSVAERLFGLDTGSLKSLDARRDFAGDGVASFPAQSNSVRCTSPGCNIKHICEVMTNTSLGNELQRLKVLRALQCDEAGEESSVCKAKSTFEERRRARQVQFIGGRGSSSSNHWYGSSWDYQTCTEFGFFQTCELNSTCMFVRGLVDLEYMLSTCDQFSIPRSDVEKAIVATNDFYGGLHPTDAHGKLGSCVMWINGEVDPWSELSVLSAPVPEQPVLYVGGASHCAWIYKKDHIVQESVLRARVEIRNQTQIFLAQDCSEEGVLV